MVYERGMTVYERGDEVYERDLTVYERGDEVYERSLTVYERGDIERFPNMNRFHYKTKKKPLHR
ncbi:hypothetical protein H9649_13400 [Sporosarcina sp. Sa2YVA2]|uniref:Uncharacterized protein n=1 Tax=Sporosarcina quadrami TaxID=2762234 RepID=A0ABR8UC41_9BACL|nr:hypothetical protein [Sporosarcina quadrami]MBD7985585.1 hypothetical protein [Sporosarcina quadrami]